MSLGQLCAHLMSPHHVVVAALLISVTGCLVEATVWTTPVSAPTPVLLPSLPKVLPTLATPPDALAACQLRLQDPLRTPHQLAQSIEMNKEYRPLIGWMHEDLNQYHLEHDRVWNQRQKMRGDLADMDKPVEWDRPVRDKNQVENAVDLFHDIIRPGFDHLSVADFHELVSLFLTPDHGPDHKVRKRLDLTHPSASWTSDQLWPTEAFIFTKDTIGMGRKAKSFGLRTHYLGLRSHLNLQPTGNGKSQLPWEFFEDDLSSAWYIAEHFRNFRGREDWPAIQKAYDEMQEKSSRTSKQRQMDDLVYFYRTQRLRFYSTPKALYQYISDYPSHHRDLQTIAGDDWPAVLEDSVEYVSKFWQENVKSASPHMLSKLPIRASNTE